MSNTIALKNMFNPLSQTQKNSKTTKKEFCLQKVQNYQRKLFSLVEREKETVEEKKEAYTWK